ncbi:MAG: SDR family oxidoreductase [Deltaproteobacteria bacterium]|nr:SDR family oxidoreductase [Deltaproteobacteria bacterium]
MARFQDRVVIITGASAGIGAAAARRFSAEGAKLVLAARDEARLQAFAASLGGEALAVPCDVARDADCDRLLAEAERAFGGVDVLVNNAGLHLRGPVERRDATELAAMVDVNLRAPVYLTRCVLPMLRARGGGAVVQVASLAGCVPLPDAATYSATKFGLRAFSLALAEELEGSGIRIGVVSPGPVDTGFIMDELHEVSDATMSQPISTAEEVAEAVLDAAERGGELKLPRASGALTTVAYALPGLARLIRPALERKGRRVKARLTAERQRALGQRPE